jgi:hypothetical protein
MENIYEHQPHPIRTWLCRRRGAVVPGVLVTIKATAEQTGGEFFLLEELASRRTATPLHVHPQDHESFYILERLPWLLSH